MNTKKNRINTESKKENLTSNPFDQLDFSKIQLTENKKKIESPSEEFSQKKESTQPSLKKQKLYIGQEKAGRAGKTVTIITGLENTEERKSILKLIQKNIGCGGTIKEETLELQGEKRDEIAKLLKEKGYTVILRGG